MQIIIQKGEAQIVWPNAVGAVLIHSQRGKRARLRLKLLVKRRFQRWVPLVFIGVVAVPMQVFYDNPDGARHLVRFAYCKRDEVLDEAVRRLGTLRRN